MKITGNQVALVLENAYLFTNLNKSFKSLGKAKKKIEAIFQRWKLHRNGNCRHRHKTRKLP